MTYYPNDPPLMWLQTNPPLLGCTACPWTSPLAKREGWVGNERIYKAHLADTHNTTRTRRKEAA